MDEKLINKTFSSLNLLDMDFSELEDVTISLTKKFIQNLMNFKDTTISEETFKEISLNCIKHLKVSCTKGPSFQNLIINTNGMLESLKEMLKNEEKKFDNVKTKVFELIANLCVKNEKCQKKIWNEVNELIICELTSSNVQNVNISAMIIYNIKIGINENIEIEQALNVALDHYDNFLKNNISMPDFLHILLDYFICSCDVVQSYKKLTSEKQRIFLYYVNDYIENESNQIINTSLLKHLTFEFKKKSDCVLKTVTSYVDSIDPEVVVTLLDIISTATAQDKYLSLLRDDASLFLNIGCLLQALHKIGKESKNTFSPIQNLEALIPNANDNADFEKEISFSFKTKLVKSLANLSYRNKRNQELAREMEIMQSIFECTNADARNPLIKEWSILAIRNLCEENSENQDIVQSLTRIGDAQNPVLTEFGLSEGVFRIKKHNM
ncbi:hypothetical protein PVAND_005681 [Polypedilum vanderplanki]|uniref:Ataxin-10 n=1 Tax=Polypedilum vanderplanki TaxID=319348 RepID=A0A9J6C0S9_POLVA|nr:hypothetical protein PVAND_005681 [Polypedilum vanderplanki]